MSRFAFVLCSLLVLMMPRVALPHPSLPDNFERPTAYRQAINAIIGDLSFYCKYGKTPPRSTDPDLRVRTHLGFVHALLSRRNVSDLPVELREARRYNLAQLREYIDAGQYPRNHLYPDENHPCFIDRDGRICAVGYLVEQTAGRQLAEQVNAEFQSEFLWRIRLPELDRWVARSGLSLLELSMIQPCYDPEFRVQVTQDSDRAPATVSITGYVYDNCCCCLTKYVVFDFGDGAVWRSPEVNLRYPPVDVAHIYTSPGMYTITGLAIAEDACGNQTGTDTWEITLTTPAFTLTAVQGSGGPPYGVYLSTTDDIRLGYLSEATVEWSDGGQPENAGWHVVGNEYRTPVHTYSAGGERNIVVTHRYDGPTDSFSEASSVDVEVGTVATHPSTWGRIKALYAPGG